MNKTLQQFLKIKGYEVYSVFDGEEALDKFFEYQFDLVLVDVKLPRIDGFKVVEYIRKFKKTPVIFITSLDSEKDVERGFILGGDDYLRKPFSLRELQLRIQALLRRIYLNEEKVIINENENIYFDVLRCELYKNNEIVHLKNKELLLLKLFLANRNRILTKEEIFSEIYSEDELPNENSLRTFVKRLRDIVGKNKIKTIKDIGYKYVG